MNDFIIMSRSDLVTEIDAINHIMDTDLADNWSKSRVKIVKSLVNFSLKCFDEGEQNTSAVLLYFCGFIVSQTESVLLSVIMELAEQIDQSEEDGMVNKESIMTSVAQMDLSGNKKVVH